MTEPLPRSRGTVFLQVLVAAVFLAVIGGSVGLAVGLRERDRGHPGGTAQTQDQPTQQEQIPGNQPGASSPSGPSCPDRVSQKAGRNDLAQALYLQTERSEVWICRDGDGAVYYLGHRFSDEGWLVLTGVRQDGDEYVASNATADGTTVYRVSPARLKIEYSDGRTEEQPALDAGG
jgi:hypothetical protein